MKSYQSRLGLVSLVVVSIVGMPLLAHAETALSEANLASIFRGDEKYLTIESLVVESEDEAVVVQDMSGLSQIQQFQPQAELQDGVFGQLDQIINIGAKIWDVVVKNKPVVNVSTMAASAVPAGTQNWGQLAGWQAPKAKIFRMHWKNKYRMDVVDFSFRVLYTYGGNVKGMGHYLTNVTVVPSDLKVLWGYTFNAAASVPNVTNAGTELNPIGAAELLSKWSVDTVIRHDEGSMSFYVKGDGTFLDLTNGN